ncbi:cro/C1-type HTH DNA-binding domain protein [Mycobacterium kansasii]|uniref:Cro/C1-type HTH DNA-binding domain protein n=1 Tax=Mycobacterium kansasii TaxID=1768 RepID=A0A1V3X3Y7_MYCKA|nr:cro/C1-type HTH DNA-binding domain protein [Mycobacterium kansasii]
MAEQRRIGFHWHLRRVMAAHNLWKSTELRPLLRSRGINLSDAQVYRLVTGEPSAFRLGPSLRSATSSTARPTTCSSRMSRCRRPHQRMHHARVT